MDNLIDMAINENKEVVELNSFELQKIAGGWFGGGECGRTTDHTSGHDKSHTKCSTKFGS